LSYHPEQSSVATTDESHHLASFVCVTSHSKTQHQPAHLQLTV
jgi:hypothetical protein